MFRVRYQQAFTLPTVIIASVVMLAVLVAAVGAVSSSRTALDMQYYEDLAKDAAESGVAMAESCLYQNGYNAQWGASGSVLRPNTTCSGAAAGGSLYVLQGDGFRTTFEVGAVTAGDSGSRQFATIGKTELIRKSNGTVWRTVSSTVGYRTGLSVRPQVSGGAGWLEEGHNGFFLSTDGQLYGYGANLAGQIADNTANSIIATPLKMTLPLGVTSVKKVVSSGQGAFFVCIIGSDNKAYCRGGAGGGNNAIMIGPYWVLLNLASYGNPPVTDLITNGYGGDSVCVVAGLGAQAQVYCAGNNDNGMLGANLPPGPTGYVSMSAPSRFILPSGLYASKVFSQSQQTCVIASDRNAYCAGKSNYGQIAGTVAWSVTMPVRYYLPPMGGVPRYPVDIKMLYHATPEDSIHVLASDGSMWSSGRATYGQFGDGTTTTVTGSGPPAWFGPKGDRISVALNSSYCIENPHGSAANFNGNQILLYGCTDGLDGTGWMLAKGSNAIVNPTLGRCLDVRGVPAPYSVVQLYDCNGSGNQQWRYEAASRNIVNIPSGLCLDVKDAAVYAGAVLQLQSCTGHAAQKFDVWALANPVEAMVVGTNSVCAINGISWGSGMYCSGWNNYGQLMNNTCTSESNPASPSVSFVSIPDAGEIVSTTPSPEWQYQYNAMQVITKSGKVYGSGFNQVGKLGFGQATWMKCETVKYGLPPEVVAVDMSARDHYSTYVLGNDGLVYSAGWNVMGQLGNGSTIDSYVPRPLMLPRGSSTY